MQYANLLSRLTRKRFKQIVDFAELVVLDKEADSSSVSG
jgi:hypothetical protein